MSTIFMFSGQGSQYFQMGRALYERSDVFAREMNEMDQLVQAQSGRSVVSAIYGSTSKAEAMSDIALSHPAIFMTEVALARTVMKSWCVPDLVLGASLGTMAAAVAAGHLHRDDALLAVLGQARCIARHAEPGAMLAVLADPSVIAEEIARGAACIASRNFDSHFVASMPASTLAAVEAKLAAANVVSQRLPVPYAFHSPWIESIRSPFLESLQILRPRRGSTGLVCCAAGRVLTELRPEHLWTIAREPVDFQRTFLGLEAGGPHRYIDLGPSSTLATFAKYLIRPDSSSVVMSVLSPFGRDEDRLGSLLLASSPA